MKVNNQVNAYITEIESSLKASNYNYSRFSQLVALRC